MFVADRLLKTDARVGTADNDINALKNMGSIPGGATVNHFLTDTDAWFLTDVPNGMKHFVRTAMSNSMDGDFDTGNVRYKARERYSFGWSDPLGMFGSQAHNKVTREKGPPPCRVFSFSVYLYHSGLSGVSDSPG
jgi:hypothetical protein